MAQSVLFVNPTISGGGGAPAGFIASHTLIEDGGNTLSSGFVYTFGQVFHISDVPDTNVFVLTNAADDSVLDHQVTDISKWESNSNYRHVVFDVWVPSLAANTELTIDISKQTGTYSQSAARTTSDITIHDYKLKVTDFRNESNTLIGSGAFTCAVNDYIGTSARRRKYATGPLRDGWETHGFFKDDTGGAADAHLMAMWMIDVLSDDAGAYHDTRLSAIFGLPYPFATSKKGFRGKMALYDGATLLRDYAEVATFASSDVNTTNDRITIAGTNFRTLQACRFTSSGSVPAGLTSGQLCYLYRVSDGVYTVHSTTRDASDGASPINLTSGGSGTHTLTGYIELPYYAAGVTLDRDADEIYVAGVKPSVRPKLSSTEKTYWLQSGMIPPWDMTLTPEASPTVNSDYYPNSIQYWRQRINGTGDTDHIGPVPLWASRWFFLQDKNGFKNLKTGSPVHFHVSRGWALDGRGSPESAAIYCGNRGPLKDNTTAYANMSTPTPDTFYWAAGTKSSDITDAPVDIGGSGMEGTLNDEGTGPDASHWPHASYLAYLVTGRRHHLRALWASANRNKFASNFRFTTYNSVEYLLPFMYLQIRGDAWKALADTLAGAVGEDSGEKAYFRDCIQDYADYLTALRTAQGANFQANGFWTLPNTQSDGFWRIESNLMRGYLAMSFLWAGVLYRGDANCEAMGAQAASAVKQIVTEAYAPIYWANARNTFRAAAYDDGTTEPAPSAVFIEIANYVTVATNGTFTFFSNDTDAASIQVGDLFRWWDTDKPAELSYSTTYKVLSKPTSNTFTCSLTTDNVLITFASAVTTPRQLGWRLQGPSTGLTSLGSHAGFWAAGWMMGAGWAQSAGHDMGSGVTIINNRMDAVAQDAGATWAKIPKFYCRGNVVIS